MCQVVSVSRSHPIRWSCFVPQRDGSLSALWVSECSAISHASPSLCCQPIFLGIISVPTHHAGHGAAVLLEAVPRPAVAVMQKMLLTLCRIIGLPFLLAKDWSQYLLRKGLAT